MNNRNRDRKIILGVCLYDAMVSLSQSDFCWRDISDKAYKLGYLQGLVFHSV